MLVVKLGQLLSQQCVSAEEMLLWLQVSICSFSVCFCLLYLCSFLSFSIPLSFISLHLSLFFITGACSSRILLVSPPHCFTVLHKFLTFHPWLAALCDELVRGLVLENVQGSSPTPPCAWLYWPQTASFFHILSTPHGVWLFNSYR